MPQKSTSSASDYRNSASAGAVKSQYDSFSIILHWATAILVLTQFALAHTWGFAPRPEQHVMIVMHMSFGILLTVLLAVRIIWRGIPANRVLPAESGLMQFAATGVHYLLYVLLIAEVILGFILRWSGNEAMSFFGLLIPPPFAPFSMAGHHLVGEAHDLVSWAIIAIAATHALAALLHHYVLRDSVLMRMLTPRPGAGRYTSGKN